MRGSQWHRWNMHVHTKGTNKNDLFVSEDMEGFFLTFFKRAVEAEIFAIGITDYFSIENYLKAKQYVSLIHQKIDDKGGKVV